MVNDGNTTPAKAGEAVGTYDQAVQEKARREGWHPDQLPNDPKNGERSKGNAEAELSDRTKVAVQAAGICEATKQGKTPSAQDRDTVEAVAGAMTTYTNNGYTGQTEAKRARDYFVGCAAEVTAKAEAPSAAPSTAPKIQPAAPPNP